MTYFYSQELMPKDQEEALTIFDKVDVLMEGTSKEHEIAFHLLTSYENEVQQLIFENVNNIYLIL